MFLIWRKSELKQAIFMRTSSPQRERCYHIRPYRQYLNFIWPLVRFNWYGEKGNEMVFLMPTHRETSTCAQCTISHYTFVHSRSISPLKWNKFTTLFTMRSCSCVTGVRCASQWNFRRLPNIIIIMVLVVCFSEFDTVWLVGTWHFGVHCAEFFIFCLHTWKCTCVSFSAIDTKAHGVFQHQTLLL